MTTENITVTRIIDAPVARVWQAWTDPDDVKQWWGPDGFTCPLARIDFRVGGTSLVSMSAPQLGFGEMYSTWHYREIVPLQRIEYIHNLADATGQKVDPASLGMPPDFPQDQRNLVTFKDLGGGQTELTVTEFGWTPGQMMEMGRLGQEQCLAKLAAAVASSD